MSTVLIQHIVIIGAGNVGQALATRLHDADFKVQVLARNSSPELPRGIELVRSYAAIWQDADIYILAVGDRDIATAAQALCQNTPKTAYVVHMSGATPVTTLAPYFDKCGVLWPLQTFTTGRVPDFSTIPAIVFATENVEALQQFANNIFSRTVVMNDDQRSRLHVAAVMVNNFTNHLCQLAGEVSHADWSLLLPLLTETVAKLQHMSPQAAQTGPAIRGDEATIARHLDLIADQPNTTKQVYLALTQSIKRANDKA